MEAFETSLGAFIRGQITLPVLREGLTTALAEPGVDTQRLAALIKAHNLAGSISSELIELLVMGMHVPAFAGLTDASNQTRLRNQSTGDADDSTRLRPRSQPDADDATRLNPTSPSRPETGAENTRVATGRTEAQTARTTTGQNTTGSPGSASDSWGNPADWTDDGAPTPEPGMTINNRFVLQSVIGRGGMGVVFKARDLRKEEAQDRNPYIAVKVLNDDFKRHPDALKALQRESRKGQNLAHPNIVNIFDFDRDGSIVYMTMEYLDGEPLDRLLKQKWTRGLPLKEALPIIEGMSRALAYAHEKGIVHSDFKPGNVFVTRDGTVKVFDFGIAQATRQTGAEAGEQTLFDAGTLGALTPSYASFEMLEGETPDPRDDIYALACVTYQLLTGRHPYDRMPASRAKAEKKVPAQVPGLTRRQWRSLQRGLALERAARSPDVETFLAGFHASKGGRMAWLGVGGLVFALVTVIAIVLPSYLRRQHIAELVSQIEHGTPVQVGTALKMVAALNAQSRATVMQQTRSALLDYYRHQVDAAFDPAKKRYGYPAAFKILSKATALYPDSAGLQDLSNRTRTVRNKFINTLNTELARALEAGDLESRSNGSDVTDILAIVSKVQPGSTLLSDPRIPQAYAKQAQALQEAGRYGRALAMVVSALSYAPGNLELTSLQSSIKTAQHFAQIKQRVFQLETGLQPELRRMRGLADVSRVRNSLLKLALIYPGDPVLEKYQGRLQRVITKAVDDAIARDQWAKARGILADNGGLLEPVFTRNLLRRINRAAGEQGKLTPDLTRVVTRDQQTVTAFIAKPDYSFDSTARVAVAMRRLAGLLPPGDPWYARQRRQIAQLYLSRAQQLGEAEHFHEAQTAVAAGQQYANLPAFAAEQATLRSTRAKIVQQQRAAQKNAQIASLKQTLLTQTAADDLTAAKRTIASLHRLVPPTDPFWHDTVPEAMSDAYLHVAAQAARRHRYPEAVSVAKAGLKWSPGQKSLEVLVQKYASMADLGELETGIGTLTPTTMAAFKRRVAGYQSAYPQAYAQAASQIEELAVQRVLSVASSNATEAGELLGMLRGIFPGSQSLNAIQLATPQAQAAAGQPCLADLAGYGNDPRGVCYDALGVGKRGPQMVVIPPGGGVAAPYAISKYEISAGDYDLYCRLSHHCRGLPVGARMPATNLSILDAEAYARWLSARTGYTYSIPTNRQWTHAAKATGRQLSANINCRIRLGGRLIKGFGLVGVHTGEANGWGLVNVLGNAQEWVRSSHGLEVRGGSYQDSISECTLTMTAPSSGKPNPATGFRLVRSLEQAGKPG